MDSKTTGIVTYLTLVGFIIALAAGTKNEYSAQHINNALVGMLFILPVALGWIPILGWILDLWVLFVSVCLIIGFIHACMGKPFELPLIGKIKIIKAA